VVKKKAQNSEDPFKLVEEDLKKTKDFAINNIVSDSDNEK
jgi:hypothetical protein